MRYDISSAAEIDARLYDVTSTKKASAIFFMGQQVITRITRQLSTIAKLPTLSILFSLRGKCSYGPSTLYRNPFYRIGFFCLYHGMMPWNQILKLNMRTMEIPCEHVRYCFHGFSPEYFVFVAVISSVIFLVCLILGKMQCRSLNFAIMSSSSTKRPAILESRRKRWIDKVRCIV